MMLVPRSARKASGNENTRAGGNPLEVFRNQAAWVLLGEPGAGKTTVFEQEAEATGGLCLRIAEFIRADLDSEWQGKPLFLDGLDEVRAGATGDSILIQLRTRLKRLGSPRFRIACRAADWFGSTDREDIESASPDGQIAVLLLDPLGTDDILAIVRENHGIDDPEAFVEKARRYGVADLLKNPQTLGLLAQAIRGEQWPTTRQETYRLACKKLAEEANKRHRDMNRSQPSSIEELLDAAGQLCAVLLLADKTGVALDPDNADVRFPSLDDYAPPDMESASQAVRRNLFRPEGEERIVPSHRSIAEYLAARWLAEQIDRHGLPLGRVLNLLLGRDGRTVAGLRGLYGWLALHCRTARTRLIEADPLTVVVYGDVKPMPPADKRRILAGLRGEAERYAAFRWDASTTDPLGALADPELTEDFIAALQAPDRDDAAQSFADCVLEILARGEALPGLSATVKKVILDDTRWRAVKISALQAWLKLGAAPQEALALLDAITDGQVTDHDDELAGWLLRHLYPEYIGAGTLPGYLHVPKDRNLFGNFLRFWGYDLPKSAPEAHLPALLDGLADLTGLTGLTDIYSSEPYQYHLSRMVGALLVRGIKLYGEHVADERLFAWLGIGADEYGNFHREETDRQMVAEWLKGHPERYKALLALSFRLCEKHENPRYCLYRYGHRLHGAAVPNDIGLWYLDQASLTANDALAVNHLVEAVNALMYQRGSNGLSLELIGAWADAHPERKHLLEPLLAWEIPEWRVEDAARTRLRNQERADGRRERRIRLSEHMRAIRSGTANVALMHELAAVWKKLLIDTEGETAAERFDSYCETGDEILAAAESGFFHCPERTDLPTVAEIVDLSIEQREHYVRLPCLVGMELRWQQGPAAIYSLADDTLRRMLAFRLTYGAESTPDWFTYLVVERPSLVADVLIDYASATLKSRQDHVNCIYPLAHDPSYRAVACIAVPPLLDRFPVRARTHPLHDLESLLKAALRYSMKQLAALIGKKLSLKGMDVAQKVYWLASAMLLDPENHEEALWRYIGKSWTRANHLVGFLSEGFAQLSDDYRLSAKTIGKLVELLAPHAELEWSRGDGSVSASMRRGDHVRAMVTRLGALGSADAAREIERLLALPALGKLKPALENARHQLRSKQRESEFRFPSLSAVAQVLANKEPTGTADLVALALDYLDDIARKTRQDNDDGFRAFWNVENKKPTGPREENLCRDVLLTHLRAHLKPQGVDCQPEADCFSDKRADIRLSYRNEFELPIEIKRDSNGELWSALRTQLIEQYAIAPKAAGYGIYLVLWFGDRAMPHATDGGKKPRSPEELATRLEAQLDPTERQRIFVRVLDVSWPA